MDRREIEVALHESRIRLLDKFTSLPLEDLLAGVTRSEHDPATFWSPKDHLAHLAGIERNFNIMIRRHFDGAADAVGLRANEDGSPRTRDEIMATVHRMTEAWVVEQRDLSLSRIIALGQQVRAETLALLSSLSDEQLAEKLPGAPWADGTVGGVLGVNADHAKMHWSWVKDGITARSEQRT